MVYIETHFKVSFKDCIGDTFPDDFSTEAIESLIEQHLNDYCNQKGIIRTNLKIIKR